MREGDAFVSVDPFAGVNSAVLHMTLARPDQHQIQHWWLKNFPNPIVSYIPQSRDWATPYPYPNRGLYHLDILDAVLSIDKVIKSYVTSMGNTWMLRAHDTDTEIPLVTNTLL